MTYWRLQRHNLERVAMEGQQWGNPGLLGPGQVCPMGWALLNFIPSHLGTPLGVVVEVFHLLPLSDGFLACAADSTSVLATHSSPEVAASGEPGLVPTLASLSAEGAACIKWMLFISDPSQAFLSSFSLEFWFYRVSLHVCCFKLYRNGLTWALSGAVNKIHFCTRFCVLIRVERLVVTNRCVFPIKILL